jgi:hypothetical protein
VHTPLPRGLVAGVSITLAFATLILGAMVRLQNRPPRPVEELVRQEIRATIMSDLAASGAAVSGAANDAALQTQADDALKRGLYTVQTGPYAGRTINLREETSRFLPAVESLYTYAFGGKRWWYLPDLDTYHYLAAAERIQRTGHAWMLSPDRVERDPWALAPRGAESDGSWHPRVLAIWHSLFSVVAHGRPLQESAAWLPVVLGVLAGLPTLVLAAVVGGTWAVPCAGALLAFAVAIVGRTFWGHADTDLYNVLFPAAATSLLTLALAALAQKKRHGAAFLTALAGVLTGLHARFWIAWWAPWMILAASATVAAFGLALIEQSGPIGGRERRRVSQDMLRAIVLLPLAYVLASLLAVLFTGGVHLLEEVWKGPSRFTGAAQSRGFAGLWPNVFSTVGELARPSIADLVRDLGGWPVMALAAGGFIFAAWERRLPGRSAAGILVGCWAFATGILATRGVRFELLAVPPLLVLAAAGAAALGRQAARVFPDGAPRAFGSGVVALALTVTALLWPNGPVASIRRAAVRDVPQVTSTWGHVLDAVRDSTSRLAVVTTWWDMGHPVKYLARRGVTIDGNTFNEPEALWVARALASSDENFAAGILQMLDSGGVAALDTLTRVLGGLPRADVLLTRALAAPDSEGFAATLRAGGLPEPVVQRVASMARAEPPRSREGILIVSDDLVPSSASWGHLGAWDFTRAASVQLLGTRDAASHLSRLTGLLPSASAALLREAAAVPESARATWCGPGPRVARGPEPATVDAGGVLRAPSGAWVRPLDGTGGLSPADGGATPALLVYPDGRGGVTLHDTGARTTSLAIVVIPSAQGVSLLTTDRSLAESLCLRLLSFGGAGLTRFVPFAQAEGVRGGAVRAYRVRW